MLRHRRTSYTGAAPLSADVIELARTRWRTLARALSSTLALRLPAVSGRSFVKSGPTVMRTAIVLDGSDADHTVVPPGLATAALSGRGAEPAMKSLPGAGSCREARHASTDVRMRARARTLARSRTNVVLPSLAAARASRTSVRALDDGVAIVFPPPSASTPRPKRAPLPAASTSSAGGSRSMAAPSACGCGDSEPLAPAAGDEPREPDDITGRAERGR